jgi:mitochondrial cardiolipin hydrolase
MTSPEFDLILRKTLDDYRLSRGERRVLRRVLAELRPDDEQRTFLRQRAFAIAREELEGPVAGALDWLEEVTKLLSEPAVAAREEPYSEAWFSPGDDCLRAILRAIGRAKTSADICVFTITDDRISAELLACNRRGVALRIVTDDEKMGDAGSDVWRLEAAGIPVRIDRSPCHMHHKYAIFDGTFVLTGSYNWTRAAAAENEENLLLTGDVRLVRAYAEHFRRIWEALG